MPDERTERKPGPTGVAGGWQLYIGRPPLGDLPPRPDPIDQQQAERDQINADPILRAMAERGEDWR